MDKAHIYDDGVQQAKPIERTKEEEGEAIRDILLREGYSWEDAEYGRHMWEKD